MRILMIEDDLDLCSALNLHFKKAGYNADFAQNGEDGLYFAEKDVYDLILLDRMLPVLDGLTLVKQLRKRQIHTPCLLYTSRCV